MENREVKDRVYRLGRKIRQHRMAQHLSQAKLALMVDTDQAAIARIEAGKHNTGIEKYIKIADALGMELKDFIDF